MEIGLSFTGAPHTVAEKIIYAKYAEEKGFHSIWIAEDYFLRDAISTIGSLAVTTSRLKLATSVVNPYTRHPALIAMTIATLDELSNGRIILGLGAADKHHIEQMGLKYESPITKIRESIEVIRKLLSGEITSYQGSAVKVNNIQLGSIPIFESFGFDRFRPVRTKVPIYIAAIGPKMLELGGELADGVILPVCCSPHFVKYAIENVKRGAEKAGRSLDDVDISALIAFAAASDSKQAKDEVKGLVAALVSFGTSSLSNEANKRFIEPFCEEDVKPIREILNKKGLLEAAKCISDEMVDNFAVAGSPDECLNRLCAYEAAGLKLACIFPMGKDVNFAIDVAASYLSRKAWS
ncbi:LLM class flavin-dependent oxidoreductase [Candidatus Bathyarchaeota archaeon]|nr:LLM class flavin-dependent oxidoreductase [Candidatus Bathyarchaeota archaeon]